MYGIDLDRNGFVSKAEVTEILEIIKELDSDVSPSKRLVNIAHAVFRILDLDSDGKIAAPELSKALKEILDALVEMLIGMLEEFYEILVDEPLKQTVEQFLQHVQMFTDDESDSLNFMRQLFTDDESDSQNDSDSQVTHDESGRQSVSSGIRVETVLQFVSSAIQGNVLGLLAGMFDNILSIVSDSEDENIKQITITANRVMKLFYIQYKEFFSKVDELASDGLCRKEDLVSIGVVCLNIVVDSVQQSAVHIQAETMNVLMDQVQAKLASLSEEYPGNLINIDRQLVLNTLSEAFGTLYEHMKESGSKTYLQALFNLFDLQNSGNIKSSDLQALACIADAAFMKSDVEDGIREGEEVEHAIEVLIRMVDVDGDGILSEGELIGCAKALIRLACDLLKNSIVLLDHSVIAAIVPVIIIALNLKSQMLGGSDTALTHADVCSVVFAVSMSEGEDEIIKYLKGLLVYKEGDVDEQVFENLCCNLVRMFLFWAPEARQYTRSILR
jgi:Ca2+-binding EF-hand superfamily protein